LDLRGRKWQEAGKECIKKSFRTYVLHKCYVVDRMKGDEIGGTFSTHMRGEKCIQYFNW